MKITLITVGRWKEPAMRALFDDYAARCQPKLNLLELELPARDAKSNAKSGELKEKEAALILKNIPKGASVIACDERGEIMSSPAFANALQSMVDKNGPEIAFIIGGADGLSAEILQRAQLKISFGKMVWPHLLVRVMLGEQIYRAQSILSGHPYHRD